jgi:hypothetical protein
LWGMGAFVSRCLCTFLLFQLECVEPNFVVVLELEDCEGFGNCVHSDSPLVQFGNCHAIHQQMFLTVKQSPTSGPNCGSQAGITAPQQRLFVVGIVKITFPNVLHLFEFRESFIVVDQPFCSTETQEEKELEIRSQTLQTTEDSPTEDSLTFT